jgi:DNA-binding transcriptional regulator YbjK
MTDDHNVRQRILQAAIDAIDEGGEAGLRVITVAKNAGVTQGMIKYYFQTRDNLVSEAQISRFLSTAAEDVEYIAQLAVTSSTPAEYRSNLRALLSIIVNVQRWPQRAVRISTFGAATKRPNMMASIARANSLFIDRATVVYQMARDRGFIVSTCDIRALALVVQGIALGVYLSDIDEHRPSDEELLDAIMLSIDGFLVK